MKQRLVVFDLGRVLIRICDGWQHAFERAGVSFPADVITADVRRRLHEGVARIEVGQGAVPEFCAEVANLLGLSCDDVTRMWEGYTLGPFPGVPELIADLHAAGVNTACLSNTNAEHWRVLTDLNDPQGQALAPLQHHFASHLIRARKPDAAIYDYLERQTGFASGDIIFFDDMPENVAAAQQRGWAGHLVERCENPIPAIRQVLQQEGIL
jgi:HAD superfamily hydrolase (TIGR01509 family)